MRWLNFNRILNYIKYLSQRVQKEKNEEIPYIIVEDKITGPSFMRMYCAYFIPSTCHQPIRFAVAESSC